MLAGAPPGHGHNHHAPLSPQLSPPDITKARFNNVNIETLSHTIPLLSCGRFNLTGIMWLQVSVRGKTELPEQLDVSVLCFVVSYLPTCVT